MNERQKIEQHRAAERTSTKSRRWQLVGVTGAAAILVVALWLIVDAISTRPLDPEERLLIKPTVDEIVENPDDHAGNEVKVSGEVDEILSQHAFMLGYDDEGLEEEVLVIDVEGDEVFTAEDDVIVSGRVVVPSESSEVHLDELWDGVSLGMEPGEPLIVADTIRPNPGGRRF